MKKQTVYYLLAAALFAGLTSCLDHEPPFKDNGDYGIVELDLSGNRGSSAPYANRAVSRSSAIEIEAIVNYTGVNGTPEDVTVTVEVDNNIVTAYNSYSKVTALPAGSYELPSSGTLVIPKGQKNASYVIRLKPSQLSSDVAVYAIGVKIVSASAGRISGNFSSGIYLVNK
ncbi:MAG: DUF1735 domain-containing protein [Tannerellaceae bacterium]|jgi:hypothetical protein|nr:DUF1735 domain-containing protein [Tannerellaceae bacterium]